ncbi:hypothetical protein Loa_02296 [Legionella oakridgensis ATCC 33761 = DSM 21215]|uniref:Uncharacterized protein n=1 Tax=Legionella oakridgensis ATCC 33761 = DSM 21215 TaxID=1268635 RepID=W0BBE5_9GAMM|nr:hypothetical protein Loa_02296 [Legionella oakridgensis ATCC 33761 = DSM 21215]ETO92639.1 hypothetical protein LOR_47c08310 [Legionella oakridgensis RV-2-2007]STY20850.1 Uncharacterised protein [Legionella longbeachae]
MRLQPGKHWKVFQAETKQELVAIKIKGKDH